MYLFQQDFKVDLPDNPEHLHPTFEQTWIVKYLLEVQESPLRHAFQD